MAVHLKPSHSRYSATTPTSSFPMMPLMRVMVHPRELFGVRLGRPLGGLRELLEQVRERAVRVGQDRLNRGSELLVEEVLCVGVSVAEGGDLLPQRLGLGLLLEQDDGGVGPPFGRLRVRLLLRRLALELARRQL